MDTTILNGTIVTGEKRARLPELSISTENASYKRHHLRFQMSIEKVQVHYGEYTWFGLFYVFC